MKNVLQNVLKRVGFEIHRANGSATMAGALAYLQKKGFEPEHIIDGGASDGRWARIARRYFPNAHITLVEMQPQYASALAHIPNATVVSAMLGQIPLDNLIKDPEHTLLKLDLDGGEPPILKDSKQTERLPAVIMECPFFQLSEKCAIMTQKGFIISRIFDLNYRADGAMTQADILFVKKDSPLR